MNLLETINEPAELRKLARTQLTPLAHELRNYLLDSVSKTGGHLSSNLGTIVASQQMSDQTMYDYFSKFGFGQKVKVEQGVNSASSELTASTVFGGAVRP